MSRANNMRQIVYRYNGDEANDEEVMDLDGDIPIPEKDDIILRNGKRWKVVMILTKTSVTHPPAIPVIYIALTDNF